MMIKRGHTLRIAAFLLWANTSLLAQVGAPVAQFSLQDLEGGTHTPARYQGKLLVLFFLGHN